MLLVPGALQFLTVWLFSRANGPQPSSDRQHHDPEPRNSKRRFGLRVIAEAPHLRHLVALVLLGCTSAAFLDYLFKAKAVEAIGSGDQFLRLFAPYYAAITRRTCIGAGTTTWIRNRARVVLRRGGFSRPRRCSIWPATCCRAVRSHRPPKRRSIPTSNRSTPMRCLSDMPTAGRRLQPGCVLHVQDDEQLHRGCAVSQTAFHGFAAVPRSSNAADRSVFRSVPAAEPILRNGKRLRTAATSPSRGRPLLLGQADARQRKRSTVEWLRA